jgi:bifunctional DNA-binding transcriptional regulator/antitoxin component of YhaV-PrlF toxin-antitoxin module
MLPFHTLKSQNVAIEAVASALKVQISSGTRAAMQISIVLISFWLCAVQSLFGLTAKYTFCAMSEVCGVFRSCVLYDSDAALLGKEVGMAVAQKRAGAGASAASRAGRVSASGRLSLPAEVRREVGLEKGGPVRIDLIDGSIRIRTMSEVKDRIRALARSSGLTDKASVSDFLGWRADERAAEAKGAKR